MNWTAVLHILGTVLVGAGIFASGQSLTLGLFGVAVIFFVAGIVVARRNDGSGIEPDVSE